MVLFLAVTSLPAGERFVSLVRSDRVALNIPVPEGDRRFRLIDNNNGILRFHGRLNNEAVEAEVKTSDQAVSYLEFARLKNDLLGFTKDAKRRRDYPGRREETRSLGETDVSLALLTKMREGREHDGRRDSGRRRTILIGSSHVYLHAGILSLSVTSESTDEAAMVRTVLEWTRDVLDSNPGGVAAKQEIAILDPANMRESFVLPLPDGLTRTFDISVDNSLPIIAMYRLDEENPELATTASIFSIISTKAVAPGTFEKMLRVSKDVFLNRPEGKLVRRDGESALFSYASPDRRWEGLTLFCVVRGIMVTFDMMYPYGDSSRAWHAKTALVLWSEETHQRNLSTWP